MVLHPAHAAACASQASLRFILELRTFRLLPKEELPSAARELVRKFIKVVCCVRVPYGVHAQHRPRCFAESVHPARAAHGREEPAAS